MTFAYDGSAFSGYQIQPNKRTIEQELETCLSALANKPVKVYASGRTDALVHAYHQVAHFDLERTFSASKLKTILNHMLPKDIYVKQLKIVPSTFNARFDVKSKTYLYKLNMGTYNPLERSYVYQYNQSLDVKKMRQALKYLQGEHNFKAFTKANTIKSSYVRTISKATIRVQNELLMFKFTGNGFMRYMVRNIVGTLIAVGELKIAPAAIMTILASLDRTKAFKTASPVGLYLADVKYEKH